MWNIKLVELYSCSKTLKTEVYAQVKFLRYSLSNLLVFREKPFIFTYIHTKNYIALLR